MQAVIHRFVGDAYKLEFPEQDSPPSLKNTEEKNAHRQPNDSDCGLFTVTKVMQLVRYPHYTTDG